MNLDPMKTQIAELSAYANELGLVIEALKIARENLAMAPDEARDDAAIYGIDLDIGIFESKLKNLISAARNAGINLI